MRCLKRKWKRRIGFKLQPAKPFSFKTRSDDFGWRQNHEGKWYFTAFIENGRVLDEPELKMKTAFLEVAQTRKAQFIFTCNQNLIISDILPEDKDLIESILNKYGIIQHTENASEIRKQSIACVALNTCALALAEAQRYLPHLLDEIEILLQKHQLAEEKIVVRMTGCPNGCARPYMAEIGFVGTSLGHYNLMLGADVEGTKLNKLYKENLDETAILNELDLLFERFAQQRTPGEPFGDFIFREKIV